MRRLTLFVVVVALLGGAVSCDPGNDFGGTDAEVCGPCWPPLSIDSWALDILLVVDNSATMAEEQARLRADLPLLFDELRGAPGGMPDLHIGVTTTDLGSGMFQIPQCEEIGGDAGNLVTGSCVNPVGGAPYLIDAEPTDCEITREPDNTCAAHTCEQANCIREPTTTLVEDAVTGCPRCRNYEGESLEEALSCLVDLGTEGCGFEQPLEAMYKALNSGNTANSGFSRANALLSVVLITDEDDCSGSNPQLYDNTQTGMNSILGPPTSYRCFEFGITCDINDRAHEGLRQNCRARDDAAALLHPVSRYRQFLHALKDPQMLSVTAITGEVQPSADDSSFDVVVVRDGDDYPMVQSSCDATDAAAAPPIRIHTLLRELQPDLPDWSLGSVCEDSYAPLLVALGQRLGSHFYDGCMWVPLQGCADPGVDFGTPQAAQTCAVNSQCLPDCRGTVSTYVEQVGWVDEAFLPCLEVCPDGPCPGNSDRQTAYADGHPPIWDVGLPVPLCWHINYNARCSGSNGALVVLSRREPEPSGQRSEVLCAVIPAHEMLCNDGKDNDEDCLADQEDPDCE